MVALRDWRRIKKMLVASDNGLNQDRRMKRDTEVRKAQRGGLMQGQQRTGIHEGGMNTQKGTGQSAIKFTTGTGNGEEMRSVQGTAIILRPSVTDHGDRFLVSRYVLYCKIYWQLCLHCSLRSVIPSKFSNLRYPKIWRMISERILIVVGDSMAIVLLFFAWWISIACCLFLQSSIMQLSIPPRYLRLILCNLFFWGHL